MERLFTEEQWRAIAEVEERTDGLRHDLRRCENKPLLGGVFAHGDYRLAWVYQFLHRGVVGPAAAEFFVYEASSEVVFTWRVCDRADVIGAARDRIEAIGPEYLLKMLTEGRQAVAARAVERETVEAAERKTVERKVKRLPKRAREVFAGSSGKCHYCGCALELGGKWHIEHKMPRALKGGSEMHNLVAACVPCNMRKKDKTDMEFQALLATESAITQASQGGVVGADESFDSLDLHGLKHVPASHSTPLI